LLKKRTPELLKEDERLLTSSEVSVSTGDSGQGEFWVTWILVCRLHSKGFRNHSLSR
jgi:hypothetical protein